MGHSNEEWGDLALHDTEFAEAWDRYERLPDAGANDVLDAFTERKGISIESLVRLGARLADHGVLAFAYSRGIKFRDLATGQMWARVGSEWPHMKIVPAGTEPTDRIIVCEGETDGAKLTELYDCDVAVMPAGARYFPRSYVEQLAGYDQVLIGLDNDEAGEDGAARITEALPQAQRFAPPFCTDWCDWALHYTEAPSLPPITSIEPAMTEPTSVLVPAGAMMELEVPEVISWFEHDLLPIGGLLILHGWAKSFKTFLALDMLAALAQGQDWCCFEPTEEPCKVATIQFELPWPYYRQRVAALRRQAREPQAFDENFFTWQPMRRPELTAGNKSQEDHVITELLNANIQVVLIDPIRRATGAIDMNAEQEVRRMLRFFERLQDEGITVVATHHDNKEAAKSRGGDALGMTGSGAWAGDPDSILSIELPYGDSWNTSTRRNINFTLRNSRALGPRSMTMYETGIVYGMEPFGFDDEEGQDTPTPAI